MLYNNYITCYSYIVEWEIITNNYITVTWCLLGCVFIFVLVFLDFSRFACNEEEEERERERARKNAN